MAGASDDEERGAPEGGSAPRVRRLAWLGSWLGWGALGLICLGLAAGLLWLAAQPGAAPGDASAASPPVAAAPPGPPAGLQLPPDRASLPASVQRYLDNTVYPPGSGRLHELQLDLLEPNRRFEDFRPIPETFSPNADEIVTVRLTSDRYYYEGDDPIELSLALRQGPETVEPLSLDAGVIREGRGGTVGARVPVRFARARDGEGFVAEIDPARFADHHGPLLVDARIEYAPGAVHDEKLRLFLTPAGRIPARFTGEIDDDVVNGSLRVYVGIEVEQPGQYRIDANLYAANGQPVAFSAFKGRLDRSDRRVPIDFFGRILRDAGARGPWRVGEIRGYRFLDGQYPDRERIPDLGGRFATGDYALARFSDDEYVSEHKLRMIELLLEDERRGIAIATPPLPTEGLPLSTEASGATPVSSPTAPRGPAAPNRGTPGT